MKEGADVQPAADSDKEKEEKAKAAAEARAARAAARAAAAAQKEGEGDSAEAPKPPSPKQPLLDRFVEIIKEKVHADAVEESFINERDDHLPCVVLKSDYLIQTAGLIRNHPELKLNYLRNVAGSDMESHMEVIYHIVSLEKVQEYALKVRTDRNEPSIPSVTPIWETANWNEREIYDLLGIDFPGHPDLRRIMMSDDWEGHPLRKDYEPLDPEV